MARWRSVSSVMTLPEATSRAASRLVGPWPRSSWVRRSATPGSRGSTGAVRSNACTWVFSSTHRTRAAWGGLRYSPTRSRTLSMNWGSVASLNASVSCGLSPNARQIRLTAVWFLPSTRARDRVDQWVASVGVISRVVTMTRSMWSSLSLRGGSGPWLVHQALQPTGDNPPAPLDDRGPGHAEVLGDLAVASPSGAGQHDPAALGQRLAGGPPSSPALQRGPLLVSQHQSGKLGASAGWSDLGCRVHPRTLTNRPRINDSGH